MRVRGGKLKIRKKLRRKSAGKNEWYVRTDPPLETKGGAPARGRKERVNGEAQRK
jgi:hypothetical protein